MAQWLLRWQTPQRSQCVYFLNMFTFWFKFFWFVSFWVFCYFFFPWFCQSFLRSFFLRMICVQIVNLSNIWVEKNSKVTLTKNIQKKNFLLIFYVNSKEIKVWIYFSPLLFFCFGFWWRTLSRNLNVANSVSFDLTSILSKSEMEMFYQ